MPLLPVLYFSVALGYFATLFKDLQGEANLSPEQRQCAWRVIILAATLWPLVLPIAYLERRAKAKQGFVQLPKFENSQVSLSSEFVRERGTQKQQESLQDLAA
jgi:hypothetical protein